MAIDPVRGGCISRSSNDASSEERPARSLYRRSIDAEVERYPRISRLEHTFPSAVDEETPQVVRERPPLISRNVQQVSSQDRAARAKLAGLPYVSTKQPQGAAELNCRVHVPVDSTDASKGSREVVCRHFAMEFAFHPGRKREVLESFKDESGVQGVFRDRCMKLDRDYHNVVYKDTASYPRKIIDAGCLGEYMAALAESLPAPALGTVPKTDSLVITKEHAMALQVQRKVKEGGLPYCEATFYDPNDTSLVKRVKVQNPEDFVGLSLKSMLVRQKLINEYNEGKPSHTVPIAVISISGHQPVELSRIDAAKLSPSQIIVALIFGSVDCLRHASEEVSRISADDFLDLVMTRSYSNGREHLVHEAFGNLISSRSADVVEAGVSIVTESNLSFEDKKSVLKGKGRNPHDNTGFEMLYLAMLNNPDAVKGFVDAVLGSSKLSSSEMVEILMEGDETEAPAFHLAMSAQDADVDVIAIRRFAEAIMNSTKLDSSQKARLLREASSNYDDAIYTGMAMNKRELVKTLVETIGHHESPMKERMEILFGKVPYDRNLSFTILRARQCLKPWLPDDIKNHFSRRAIPLAPRSLGVS